jgi:hypothetical protein
LYAALAKPGLTAEIGRFVEIDVGLLVAGTVTAAIDQIEPLGGVGQRDTFAAILRLPRTGWPTQNRSRSDVLDMGSG